MGRASKPLTEAASLTLNILILQGDNVPLRRLAKSGAAINQLLDLGLIKRTSRGRYSITLAGLHACKEEGSK